MTNMDETLKLLINHDLDKLFIDSLQEYIKGDGGKCEKCGVIQGKPLKGWNKFYCKHFEHKINKKFSKREKELLREDIGIILKNISNLQKG